MAFRLHRVWRLSLPGGTTRDSPWRFASADDDPDPGGRFDLPGPVRTCYLATSAVLEALQAQLVNLSRAELAVRRRATIVAPSGVPGAARRLTARVLAGQHGAPGALWAGSDRAFT